MLKTRSFSLFFYFTRSFSDVRLSSKNHIFITYNDCFRFFSGAVTSRKASRKKRHKYGVTLVRSLLLAGVSDHVGHGGGRTPTSPSDAFEVTHLANGARQGTRYERLSNIFELL